MGVGVDIASESVVPESSSVVPSDQIPFLGMRCLDRLFLTDLTDLCGVEWSVPDL